ncbi:tetratricopeptide repeat protein [Marixanthomonas ophiurae]|uniref:tetratricopeptide repeat protein n=1 Tax=Marixanthomonas ophiurae TaxID=387659 RepID=UPI001EFE1F24|nr:tetratricopeptide repeat protein [Marixanthomonas ophiurae]
MKYYLSLFCVVLLFSCANSDDYSILSKEERTALSKKVFEGGSHLFQGSPKSMTRIEKAIEIDPNNCDAVRELSIAYLKRGMPDKWKLQIDKAVACDPVIWQPYRGYNYLWFYRDYKKAIADFNASDTLTPNFIDAPQGHSVDYWRGIAYLGLKDHENSIKYFNKNIHTETEKYGEDWVEPTAFLYRGIAYYESNDVEKALADFDKVLLYNNNRSADAKYYKAHILKARGKNEEALALTNNAIEDYNTGSHNNRHYVETLRQLYSENFTELLNELKN